MLPFIAAFAGGILGGLLGLTATFWAAEWWSNR